MSRCVQTLNWYCMCVIKIRTADNMKSTFKFKDMRGVFHSLIR
jgi:hypothetical protein